MNRLKERMRSDRAASGSVETIIIIALAVFAALALFTFILKPVQNSSDSLGQGIDMGIDGILKSGGENIQDQIDKFGQGGDVLGSGGTK